MKPMKGNKRWAVALWGGLLLFSALVYVAHYLIFRNVHDLVFYGLMDVASLPVSALIVTFILQRLLEYREKQSLLRKLDMVIGAFFSEVGTGLLKTLFAYVENRGDLLPQLLVKASWTGRDFARARREISAMSLRFSTSRGDLPGLKQMLASRRHFLLGLLENQNLLEHATFTDLIWATFHLAEELDNRPGFSGLP